MIFNLSRRRNSRSMGGGSTPFLTKTYEIVDDPATDDVISWGEDGGSFVVWKNVEFAGELLPKHFKHNNFSSFIRQLNIYGFRKVVAERWEFINENFRRGEQRLLSDIHRRKPPVHSMTLTDKVPPAPSNFLKDEEHSSTSTTTSTPLPNYHHHQQQQLILLSRETEKLKNDNKLLADELHNVRNHRDILLGLLSKYDDDDDSLPKKLKAAEAKNGVRLFGVRLGRSGGCNEEKPNKKARLE